MSVVRTSNLGIAWIVGNRKYLTYSLQFSQSQGNLEMCHSFMQLSLELVTYTEVIMAYGMRHFEFHYLRIWLIGN